MSVKFYKRKPAFIQAIKITGTEENLKEIYEFTKGYTGASYEQFKDYFPKKGYVYKNTSGKPCYCSTDTFEDIYEVI